MASEGWSGARCARPGCTESSHSHHKGEAPLLGYSCIGARERRDCPTGFAAESMLVAQVSERFAGVTAIDATSGWESVEQLLAADKPVPVNRVDRTRIEGQLSALRELFIMGELDKPTYVARSRALKATLEKDTAARGTTADKIAARPAYLRDLRPDVGAGQPRRSGAPSWRSCSSGRGCVMGASPG